MTAAPADIRTPRPRAALGLIAGYSHLALEVSDVARATHFYAALLGFEYPRVGDQYLELVQRAEPKTLPETGVHQAYRVPDPAAATARLRAAGVQVHDYREDRPAEREQNRYCSDPDGNRVQLLQGPSGIDHVAIETHDIEWAETFYTQVLGGIVETRVGWHMEDYAVAHRWAPGQAECAPGTRRWDKRYFEKDDKGVARPNPQIFVDFGGGTVLGIYLATEHRQEPPPDEFRGTPRIGLRATPGRLGEIEQRLRDIRLRSMMANPDTGGPFERDGAGLFVRDPGGNFLEITG